MSIIRIRNLGKAFGDLTALDGVSLDVAPGERFGLIGPDGAGKTTLMRILCGLMKPDSGSFTIDGMDGASRIRDIKATVGYMPQRFSLYPDLTVDENLRFFGDLFNVPAGEMAARRDRLMQFSRLSPFQHRRTRALSGGMKQKLALSCALIHTPAVLILDEPTTGVDPLSRRDFWRILTDLSDHDTTAILVSTPYMDEARRCHRVAFLHNGRIMASDRPDRLGSYCKWKILETSVPEPAAFSRMIAELPDYRAHRILGDRIRIAVKDAGRFRKQLEPLRSCGEFPEPEEKSPDLEDVFIYL
nr:ABC transporter ATP-binding protein [bacterium]